MSKCYKISIDSYYSDNLYVLNLYNSSSASGYDVYSFSYGSLASTIKIVPVVTPYLTFTPTNFTSTVSSSSLYQWFYVYSNASVTNSTITAYRQDDTLSSHLATGVYPFAYTGVCYILATSKNCLIYSQGNTSFTILSLNQSSTSFLFSSADVSPLVSTNNQTWRISDNCKRFSLGNTIYTSSNGTTF